MRRAAARTRSCGSRSARSTCSPSSSGSRAASAACPARGRATRDVAEEEVLLYARDLQHLLEIERGQRTLLQDVVSRDRHRARDGARVAGHGHARAFAARAALRGRAARDDRRGAARRRPGIEYGFLLHDVGKIGIPDGILQKPGPLTRAERRLMQTHTVLGEQMLGGVAFLQGEGLAVVRSHHERWDGRATPTGSPARRSRSVRACSPSPTRSTR